MQSPKTERRRLVIDLDGTICTQMPSGRYIEAEPCKGVISQVNRLWADGWDIVIFTARGMKTHGGDAKAAEQAYRVITENWLKENRVCYTELIFGKPAGDFYVDDKGMNPHEFATRNF